MEVIDFEGFKALVNESKDCLFWVQGKTLRFRNWSYGMKNKVDRCAFRHTSVRAKVRANFETDQNRKLLFSIKSSGVFFVMFFLVVGIIINFMVLPSIFQELGVLKIIGLSMPLYMCG